MNKIEEKTESAQKRADALLGLMQSLTDVLEEETSLVCKQNFEGLEALRERKARLARDYQMDIKALAQKPDLLKSEPEETRVRLRQVGEKLAAVTQRNAQEIKAAIGATQALVQTIMDAARSETKTSPCYTDPRKTPLMLGSYSPICHPVAINQTA